MTMQKDLPLKRAPFKPTPKMIEAAEAVFVAMALERTIREVVEGYMKKILAEFDWPVRPDLVEYADGATRVTDLKYTFMLSTEDMERFAARCIEERVASKLHVEQDNHCPLLVAEGTVRDAKALLVDEMYPVIGMTAKSIMQRSVTDFNKMVDLTLKLLAPYVNEASAMLDAIARPTVDIPSL